MKTIGFIGGGNMGGAIIAGLKKRFHVLVCETDKKRLSALKRQYKVAGADLMELVEKSEVIVLAVKPQNFDEVLQEIPLNFQDKLFISIAAGITTAFMEKRLGPVKVVRAMPNLPALIGEGMTGISAGSRATKADVRLACEILGAVGKTAIVEERYLDAVTAVSGSGPAYVFLFAESLLKAARMAGLSEKDARLFVNQTLTGSVRLLRDSPENPAVLRQRVTSKGGTTQAALDVLNKAGFSKAVVDAVKAAKRRAKELAK